MITLYIFEIIRNYKMRKKSYLESITFTFLDQVTKSIAENNIVTQVCQVLYQLVLICCFFITNNPTH